MNPQQLDSETLYQALNQGVARTLTAIMPHIKDDAQHPITNVIVCYPADQRELFKMKDLIILLYNQPHKRILGTVNLRLNRKLQPTQWNSSVITKSMPKKEQAEMQQQFAAILGNPKNRSVFHLAMLQVSQ